MIYIMHAMLFLIVFCVDRITKAAALLLGENVYCVNPMLSFQVSYNRGISWGMFHQEGKALFIAISFIIFVFILLFGWYAFQVSKKRPLSYGYSILSAGALSNFFDRLLYGAVVDFISLSYGDLHWPIFNCADACILFGVCIMVIHEWHYEHAKTV